MGVTPVELATQLHLCVTQARRGQGAIVWMASRAIRHAARIQNFPGILPRDS